jgi:hypothetical protein
MNRKGNGVSPSKGHDLGTALHPRTLLGQNELASREVFAGL